MYIDYLTVLMFLLLGTGFVIFNLFLAWLIRPHNPTHDKLIAYECGEEPVGPAWIQFNNRFYVIALCFLIFEVEIVFLFPWAVVFRGLGLFAFVEMLIFIVILVVGLAYIWVKGDLEWVRPLTHGEGAFGKTLPPGGGMKTTPADATATSSTT